VSNLFSINANKTDKLTEFNTKDGVRKLFVNKRLIIGNSILGLAINYNTFNEKLYRELYVDSMIFRKLVFFFQNDYKTFFISKAVFSDTVAFTFTNNFHLFEKEVYPIYRKSINIRDSQFNGPCFLYNSSRAQNFLKADYGFMENPFSNVLNGENLLSNIDFTNDNFNDKFLFILIHSKIFLSKTALLTFPFF
jgi:hypothetical protein